MKFHVIRGLDTIKAELCAKVDAEAGQVRLRYITDAPGQQMVYQEKRREAEEYLSLGASAITPHLVAEAQLLGITVDAMAQQVLQASIAWASVSPTIETTRLAAKAAINASTTVAAARAAANIDWSSL